MLTSKLRNPILKATGIRMSSTRGEPDLYNSLKDMRYKCESECTEKPPTNKKYIRLYGFNLCPFVERVRLALRAKHIPY